jgi:hypothetical protein
LTGFLVAPRGPFAPAFMSDGNGRSGREAGNNGFRMDGGRAGCREGEVGEARGDETRGRVVLIVSDIGRFGGVVCVGWMVLVGWMVWECNAGDKIQGYLRGGCTR